MDDWCFAFFLRGVSLSSSLRAMLFVLFHIFLCLVVFSLQFPWLFRCMFFLTLKLFLGISLHYFHLSRKCGKWVLLSHSIVLIVVANKSSFCDLCACSAFILSGRRLMSIPRLLLMQIFLLLFLLLVLFQYSCIYSQSLMHNEEVISSTVHTVLQGFLHLLLCFQWFLLRGV